MSSVPPENLVYDSIVNLELSMQEVEILMNLLTFAKQAAVTLYDFEKQKGTSKGAEKMRQFSNECTQLHSIIAASIGIGEPETKEIH